MSRGIIGTAFALGILLCFTGKAYGRFLGIVSPSAEAPTHLAPGNRMAVEVALPIALTPPPGVQKAKVWKDWHVVIERQVEIGFGRTSKHLRYELRLLRIRPGTQNSNYLMQADVFPWLPAGTYDVSVRGPGFAYSAPVSLNLSGEKAHPFRGSVTEQRPGTWLLNRSPGAARPEWLEAVVARDMAGVEVWLENQRLRKMDVVWACNDVEKGSDGRRLIRFRIPADIRTGTLSFKPHQRSGQQVVIAPDAEVIRPLEWVELRVKSSFSPIKVVWRFVDGEMDEGDKVRYRWMVGTQAIAEVTAFDEYATPWTTTMARPLRMPLSRSGQMCAFSAAGGDTADFPVAVLMKICVESFFNLME